MEYPFLNHFGCWISMEQLYCVASLLFHRCRFKHYWFMQRLMCVCLSLCVLQVGKDNCKPFLFPNMHINVSLGLGTLIFQLLRFNRKSILWNWTIGANPKRVIKEELVLHLGLYIMKVKGCYIRQCFNNLCAMQPDYYKQMFTVCFCK